MSKYKVGDKVRVRDDLEVDVGYYMENGRQIAYVSDMNKFLGKIVTISLAHISYYEIVGDDEKWCFSDEMFEELRADSEYF